MKWTLQQQHLFEAHIAEGVREIGILWLVFSMLDRLVVNQLTFSWALTNILAAVAAWMRHG